MTGFEFLPLVMIVACFALTNLARARSAERHAADWEKIARDQGQAIETLRDALKTQGEALNRLMHT